MKYGRRTADTLSMSRVLLALPTGYMVVESVWHLAALFMALAVLSDLVDGPVARRFAEETPGGGLLDHGSDAFFVSWTLAAAASAGHIPLTLPILVVASFVQYTLDSRALQGKPLRPSSLGRLNGIGYFFVLGFVIGVPLLGLPEFFRDVTATMAWLLVATTLLSMAERIKLLLDRLNRV